MKKAIYIFIFMFAVLGIKAQNDVDVLRYSQTTVGGTARSIGFGGAVGSLGADFSSLNVNPAGIGLYKKSELSITPTFYVSKLNTSMNGFNNSANKDNFNLNNYGLVSVRDLKAKKGLKYIQFGIGVNRTNNFNNYYHITNENAESSLMTDYQAQAYGNSPDDLDRFSTYLAWDNYLLDTTKVYNGTWRYTSPLTNGGVTQELKNTTWGSMNEMNITIGSSFSDILYLGGSIGFPFVRYFEEYEYTETDLADTINDFDKFILDKKLETHGSGINFKLGMIFRPLGFLRFGLAFHSPTWMNLNDDYSSQISRYWDSGKLTKTSSPQGHYSYEITTPMKIIGSATFTLARFIMLSADAEYINYSDGRLNSHDYGFYDENAEVRDKYKPTINIRTGAEIRLRPMSFRAGLAYYGSPYANELNDGSFWIASAGLGYRDRIVFVDLGVSYSIKNEDYYLYNPELISATSVEYHSVRIALTMGYKF